MGRPWIKLHTSMLFHAETQELAGEDYKLWVNLLLLAGTIDDGGVIGPAPNVAFALHMTPADLARGLSALNGRVTAADDGQLCVRDWHEWQAQSDRDRKRAQRSREAAAVTDGHEPSRDVTDGHESPDNRIEESREEEKENGAGKPARPDQLMFEALCRWRRLDVGKLTPNMRGRLNKQGATLRAAGYDAADVDTAAKAWKREHWKGQRNEPPTPADVEEWLARDAAKAPGAWVAVGLDDA